MNLWYLIIVGFPHDHGRSEHGHLPQRVTYICLRGEGGRVNHPDPIRAMGSLLFWRYMSRKGWMSEMVIFPTCTATEAYRFYRISLAARSGQIGMVVWAISWDFLVAAETRRSIDTRVKHWMILPSYPTGVDPARANLFCLHVLSEFPQREPPVECELEETCPQSGTRLREAPSHPSASFESFASHAEPGFNLTTAYSLTYRWKPDISCSPTEESQSYLPNRVRIRGNSSYCCAGDVP